MEDNKKDLESMNQLRKEYERVHMTKEQLNSMKETISEAKQKKRLERQKRMFRRFSAVAAVIAAFFVLPNTSPVIANAMQNIPVLGKLLQVVTFRDYQYESERHNANIEVLEMIVENQMEDSEAQKTLEKSIEEINAEIQEITSEIVAQFETYLEDEEGYQDVTVKSEVLTETDQYFTLKLNCYQGAGSGYQWNYFYTVDMTSGKRMELKDVFVEGTEYKTVISENIKKQMQEQMDADEMVCYWLHDEIEALNFKEITDETSFYINEDGNLVIGFNEGDVAPMYMGAVEFEIPDEVIKDIRKLY